MVSLIRVLRRCAGALLLAQAALAAETGPPLTLAEAIALTLDRHPDLAVFEHEVQAQQGRVRQAGARAPLELQAQIENALGTGDRSGLDAAETTLSLGMTLDHGARRRRLEAARAGTAVLDAEIDVNHLDLAAETARRFVALLEGQELLGELERATALARETIAAVRQRVEAAKAPPAEVARAEALLARATLDQEHGQHELAAARQRLSAMWGDTGFEYGAARGDVTLIPPIEDFAALRVRIEHNRDLERLLTERRLREAEIRLAEMQRRPPWQISAGLRHFADAGDIAFAVGLRVPLAVRAQTDGAITVAQAQAARTDAEANALRMRIDVELFGLYQELRHAYAEAATLRDTVLPLLATAADESRAAYERGRYGYAEWIAAQRELLESRRELLRACADLHLRRIEIERLTGAALSGQLDP